MPVAGAVGLDDPLVAVDPKRGGVLAAPIADRAGEAQHVAVAHRASANANRVFAQEPGGALFARVGEAELFHGQRLPAELAEPVGSLVEVPHRAAGLGVGRKGPQHHRAIEPEPRGERIRRFLPAILERVEHTLLREAIDLGPGCQEVEVSGGRPVVGGPARQAQGEGHVAQVGHVERGHPLAQQVHGEPPRPGDEPFEDVDPPASPEADLLFGVALVDRPRAFQLDVPGLEHHLHRVARFEVIAHPPGTEHLLAAAEHQADVVDVHRVQVEGDHRQRHRRADLQEAPHPAIGQVDLHFLVGRLAGGGHLEAGGVDLEPGGLVAADLLELGVEGGGVVDVGGAAGELADVLEHLVARPQPAVARFVAAEALEEDLVGMDGDHRVEHEPGVVIALVEVVEILLPRLVEGLHPLVAAFADIGQLALDRIELAGDLGPLRGDRRPVDFLLPGEPLLVGRAVFRVPAEVGDDHVVQRADRFAEGQPGPQLAREEGRRAERIGGQRDPRAVGAAVDHTIACVSVVKLHREPPPVESSGARRWPGRRPESSPSSRSHWPCCRWRRWPTAG